ASGAFVDPDTNATLIPAGGALESQALGPILSNAEMAHAGRTFAQAVTKLAAVPPLKLASNLPADVSAAIAANPTYQGLFQAAFGDPAITAARIAYAVATYERSLVPNQTPFDAWAAGNPAALTPNQMMGFNLFNTVGRCNQCHVGVTFTDGGFHNLGLRPIAEDNGRQAITGLFADRGKFKTPSLRNVALRNRFFHNGQIAGLVGAVDFYNNGGGPFPDNRDPILAGLTFTPLQRDRIVDFLQALTDPRAAAGTFPYDRPTLYSEANPPGSNRYGLATPGSGGVAPAIIASTPPSLGSPDFRFGVVRGFGGASGLVGISAAPAIPAMTFAGAAIHIDPATLLGLQPIVLSGAGPGAGAATFHAALSPGPAFVGLPFYVQFALTDPGAPMGVSATQGAAFTLF
ncbi:MAG TPA: cytochrome c peroxidase, partial [Planctomycetota bacterium]|nr:cytochrome c peroxidase [Planctomycetota bacterium]